jgi:hypothetical protein
MKMRIMIALVALLAFIQPCSPTAALADTGPGATIDRASPVAEPTPEACRVTAAQRLDMAQGQLDCCKAHKGLCGCRAGKIICCDNTASTSPGCTCHSESGVGD